MIQKKAALTLAAMLVILSCATGAAAATENPTATPSATAMPTATDDGSGLSLLINNDTKFPDVLSLLTAIKSVQKTEDGTEQLTQAQDVYKRQPWRMS